MRKLIKSKSAVLGISNQRETSMCWERYSGKPIYNAIVWQCARGTEICKEIEKRGFPKKFKGKQVCVYRPISRQPSWPGSSAM